MSLQALVTRKGEPHRIDLEVRAAETPFTERLTENAKDSPRARSASFLPAPGPNAEGETQQAPSSTPGAPLDGQIAQ